MKLAIARSGIITLLILLLGACDGSGALLPQLVALADSGPPGEGELSVNVNTATLAELVTIPGIADTLARRIVSGRPYERVEDLLRVKGIGDYTLGSIRPYVKVEGKTQRL